MSTTYAAIDQRGRPCLVECEDTPLGFALVIQKDGPILGTRYEAKWDGKCHRTAEGVDISEWIPDQTRGFGPREAYARIAASVRYTSDEIARIQARVQEGYYDSTKGLRPDVVFVDRDGDIAISYPGGPTWMGWETKVSRMS